jgi:AcrR family transcriptional regulator
MTELKTAHDSRPPSPASRRARSSTSARRDDLVQIARRLIASDGLEGLRTRHVAEQAGIDTGTLHYHFPSKEALIQGVVESLVADFARNLAVQTDSSGGALDDLRREFLDAALRITAPSDQIRVLCELRVRSYRDPAIADMLARVDRQWNASLASSIARAQQDGLVRRDLEADVVASVIRTEIEGLAIRGLAEPSHVQEIATALCHQLTAWLAPQPQAPRAKRRHRGRR